MIGGSEFISIKAALPLTVLPVTRYGQRPFLIQMEKSNSWEKIKNIRGVFEISQLKNIRVKFGKEPKQKRKKKKKGKAGSA